jgi:hypothetical protein
MVLVKDDSAKGKLPPTERGRNMTKVIVDEVLRTKLHNLTEPLELCDESGRVLGQVFPVLDLSDYEPWEPPMSEEELQRGLVRVGL